MNTRIKLGKVPAVVVVITLLASFFVGFASPVGAAPLAQAPGDVVINEIRIDQPSTDNDEYFELAGEVDTSLDGLTYLVIGDGTGGSGVIEAVVDLGDQAIPASGYFVAAESTFSLGTADLTTSLNFENSDNVTHLLVSGFTGANGDDLDTDDDGTLDVTPWGALLDLIALVEEENPPSGTEYHYGPPTIGPDGAYVPGHVFLCPDGWQIGGFTLGSDDTPGAANACGGGIEATKTDALVVDNNDDGLADPGDTIRYTVVIENTGSADATSVEFRDTPDPNTTLEVGSVTSTQGAVTSGNGSGDISVAVDVGALAGSGGSVTIEFQVTVNDPFPAGVAQVCNQGFVIFNDSEVNTDDPDTPGAADSTCTPAPVPLPDVVINEVNADQVSTDSAEFVELYDGGAGNTDLTGLVLVLFNGSDDASYLAFDLDGQSTDDGGYFVLCGDAGNVANCDLDVSPNTNLIQNGADAVALYVGDASGFPNDTPVTISNLVDAIVYDTNDGDDAGLLTLLNVGQPQVNEGAAGDSTGHSNQRCPNGSGGARNTDTYGQYAPTPGEATFCTCGDPATFIHDVQGSGDVSPLDGESDVVIEGVVVGDFQDTSTQLRGFFLQEEDTDADADPMTSEGVFVYDYGFMDVNVGDVVRVMGDVTEYYGFTQLGYVSDMAVCPSGGSASAATVTLPVSSLGEWEQYEGMLINIPQTLYATGNYYQGYRGEVDLSVDDRLDTPTNVVAPGAAANALQDLNDRSRIQLDDGSRVSNPLPLPPYVGDGNTLRAGDTIPGLTGVLGYDWGEYEVHPTGVVRFTRVNTRDATPPDVGGTLKVASFNVLNYFATLDDSGPICGPTGGQDCRGADNAAEFTRQRDKIIAAIVAMDADIVGLMEMENHPTDAALQDLVNGLNDAAGAGTYDFVPTGPIGDDVIKVAFIYKPATVAPVGSFAILDSSVNPLFNDDKNRPALAQTFEENETGGTFTAVVNHLKSKGSACDDLGDPDVGDGQGNCNLTRKNAAIALVNWLATDPTGSGDPDFLIIGDLNAYAMEDPIAAIKAAGYTNLIESFIGAGAHSYVYYGQVGYLDHALSNPDLTGQVAGAAIWHINADEPAALDYNDYNQPDLYNPDQYRASDHDPVIVGLNLQPETVPFETFDIHYSTIHWYGSKGYFAVSGRLELPEGYTRDDLTRDLELALAIGGKSAADAVSLAERGQVWSFRGKPQYPIAGVQLTRAFIVWPRSSASRSPIFILRGTLSLPGVNRKTRPAEATVGLSLPVADDQLAERVVGEETISFRTYRRLWLYRSWHR